MNRLSVSNIIKNNAKSTNKISLSVHEGVLRGNIIEEPDEVISIPVVQTCTEYGLDFSCPENSQYISLI